MTRKREKNVRLRAARQMHLFKPLFLISLRSLKGPKLSWGPSKSAKTDRCPLTVVLSTSLGWAHHFLRKLPWHLHKPLLSSSDIAHLVRHRTFQALLFRRRLETAGLKTGGMHRHFPLHLVESLLVDQILTLK